METHGIVEIGDDGWDIPRDIEDCSTDDILDAIRLTFTHAPRSGFGQRQICGDMRNYLADELESRGEMRIEEHVVDEDGLAEDEVCFTLDPFGRKVGIAKMPAHWKEEG